VWFTAKVNSHIRDVWTNRNKSSILTKMMVLGYAAVVMQVLLGKVVNIFLSYILEALEGVPGGLPVQTLIFILIGLCMFLVPAIPGGPVYIAGGVLLVNSSWRAFSGETNNYKNNEIAFWIASLYSSIICLVIKFCAIAFEQKIIGEKLGAQVWVRSFVGVNSILTRSIKEILKQPGFHINKVAVLVGGPDWPTSVITGILHLNLGQMLLGSFPVFFFYIIPSVIAGGFMLRPSPPYSTLTPLCLAFATGLNLLGPTLAVYFLDKCANEKWDELNKIPLDQEVLKLERENYKKVALHYGWRSWEGLTWIQKFLMFLGSGCMIIAIYLFFGFSGRCFYPFKVTDKISEKFGTNGTIIKNGSVLNVVKPLGWVALGLTLASFIFYKILSTVENRNTKLTLDEFDFTEVTTAFRQIYTDCAKDMYACVEKPNPTFEKPMLDWLVELFYGIMQKTFNSYIGNGDKNPWRKNISQITNKDMKNEIEKDPRLKHLKNKIMLEGAQKLVSSLKSRKEWVEERELISEDITTDFGVMMAANFCVIAHLLKTNINKSSKK